MKWLDYICSAILFAFIGRVQGVQFVWLIAALTVDARSAAAKSLMDDWSVGELSLDAYQSSIRNDRCDGWLYDARGRVCFIPTLLPDRSIPDNAYTYSYATEELYGELKADLMSL
jgi:hypothetical protein